MFPSVTSILNVLDKAFLTPWAVRLSLDVVRKELEQRQVGDGKGSIPTTKEWVENLLAQASAAPDAVRNSSAAFGIRAHAAIDAIIRGEPMPADLAGDTEIAPVVEGFRRWYASSGIVLCPAGDMAVYSRTYRYAGAADCLGYRPSTGALVVLDFKTSNSIHGSYALQLAAYAHAVREMWASGELDVRGLVLQGTSLKARGSGSGATAHGQEQHLPDHSADAAAAKVSLQNSHPASAPVSSQERPVRRRARGPADSEGASAFSVSRIHGNNDAHTSPSAELHSSEAIFSSDGLSSALEGLGGGLGAGMGAFPPSALSAYESDAPAAFGVSAPRKARVATGAPYKTAAATEGAPPKASTARKPKTPKPAPPPTFADEAALLSLVGLEGSTPLPSSVASPIAAAAFGAGKAQFSTSASVFRPFLSCDGSVGYIPRCFTLGSRALPTDVASQQQRCQATLRYASSVSDAALSSGPAEAEVLSAPAGVTEPVQQRGSAGASSSLTGDNTARHASPTAPSTMAALEPAPLPLPTASPMADVSPSHLGGPFDTPVEALIVRLDKTTGAAEVKRVADLDASFGAFKAALLLWHAVGGGSGASAAAGAGGGPTALVPLD